MRFSGDFQCALFAVGESGDSTGNLLAANTKDEQSTAWWNRGRMRLAQLRGVCLAYPEYSTVRHFKLRGMVITLRFTDIGWSATKDQQNNPLLAKFTFTLDVVPDKAARGPRDEQTERVASPKGPKPPSSCYP